MNPFLNQAVNLPRRAWGPKLRRWSGASLGAIAVSLSLLAPALAGDPFRPNNPRGIGDNTQAAFESIFKDGNYPAAQAQLDAALRNGEASDPLVQAMLASMAYLDGDMQEMAARASLTQSTAAALMDSDPLRGNLYSAVGVFLEGATIFETQGAARGTPVALRMLQQVFSYMNAAERIDPTDPELSLVKGYMDLLLAVNLPFVDPQQAIERLDAQAYPAYLAQRGLALGYRDLNQPERALAAVNRALETAPNNPELHYLKGQIYAKMGNRTNGLIYFARAVEKVDQLPRPVARDVLFEHCRLEGQQSGQACLNEAAAAVGL